MKCSRAWAVEAARDGRLTGAEADMVTRHIALCADCRDEARRLDALGEALRSLPVREVDALSAKRAKQRLLSAADQAVLQPSRRAPWAAGLVAASLAGAGALWAFGLRDHPTPTASAAGLSSAPSPVLAASVEAPEAARWSQTREGRVETVTLSEGSLSLHVRRASPAERVIVVVPDGEIEDLGTTFTVDVEQGKTVRVAVVEGSVELRRRGEAPVHIDAGEIWRRPPEPAAQPSAPPAPPSASLPRAAPSGEGGPSAGRLVPHGITPGSRPPASAGAGRPAPGASSPGASSPGASSPGPSALEQGYEAMRAGRYGEAAERFGAAERSAQGAAERGAEDAAYLRVIALVRAGDKAAAREAARAYLGRFPQGFRRPEIEAIAR